MIRTTVPVRLLEQCRDYVDGALRLLEEIDAP